MGIDERNRRVYADPGVVKHYAGSSSLQPAERTILDALAGELGGASLLDIGVGGGRTTLHFAPRVKRYVGLDYSPAMLAAVTARFADRGYAFILGDARSLPFADTAFDAVLFSHNGIDYVDHEDRLLVLAEVRRVLWPGGLFIFSTHNLEREDLRFEAAPHEGVLRRALHARRRARLRARNPEGEALLDRPYAVINDGAFDFRAATYHIRSRAQVEQLASAGFERVRLFSGVTGKELHADAARIPDPWLYFVCRSC